MWIFHFFVMNFPKQMQNVIIVHYIFITNLNVTHQQEFLWLYDTLSWYRMNNYCFWYKLCIKLQITNQRKVVHAQATCWVIQIPSTGCYMLTIIYLLIEWIINGYEYEMIRDMRHSDYPTLSIMLSGRVMTCCIWWNFCDNFIFRPPRIHEIKALQKCTFEAFLCIILWSW